MGIKNGLNLGVPSPLAKAVTSFKKVCKPPIPVPQITPILSLSSWSFKPASLIASSEVTIANCVKRSILRASFLSINWVASKFLTSQEKRVLNLEVSNWVVSAAPLTPFDNPFQYSSKVFPMGVNAPNPVTTTLRVGIK